MCTLDNKRNPQYMFDLFFNKNFEVSHDRKQGNVHYFGYTEEDQFKVEDSDISKTLAEDTQNDGTPKSWLYARFSQDKGNNNKNKGQSGRTGTSSTSRPLGDGESMEHESVKLFLKKEAWKEKHMMGTLDTKRIPQHKFNLFFNQNFEVSHDRAQGSVHYFGFIKKDSQASNYESLICSSPCQTKVTNSVLLGS
ncbi:histone deacetylase HDT1 [Artemisia annua]|uniref:Histone deacetylase HDT1 n=1 Tax=Artemisia annua TaxID=35608 RepID=A0A2U1L2A0_ARTAN|nr:histone deacetylase HDT1 [Artemisia annua]